MYYIFSLLHVYERFYIGGIPNSKVNMLMVVE